jgi:hypothetical protein
MLPRMSAPTADTAERTKPRFTRGDNQSLNGRGHVADKRTIKGPYSRLIDRGALGVINGRTRAGKFLRAYEKMLIDHCGGNPSITQRALISRTTRLALHLELLDERALKDGKGLSATDCHFYCVWSNSLARHLAKRGFERPKPKASPLSIDSILARARAP